MDHDDTPFEDFDDFLDYPSEDMIKAKSLQDMIIMQLETIYGPRLASRTKFGVQHMRENGRFVVIAICWTYDFSARAYRTKWNSLGNHTDGSIMSGCSDRSLAALELLWHRLCRLAEDTLPNTYNYPIFMELFDVLFLKDGTEFSARAIGYHKVDEDVLALTKWTYLMGGSSKAGYINALEDLWEKIHQSIVNKTRAMRPGQSIEYSPVDKSWRIV
ncbi:hypothetical protein OPT61_g10461 [Boeremia exigua]|uniref:Uncharacterized protein n=1 Tax=Boeremia exigua TaxID=749465 RepID=A0ACC2HQ52_9PLEO|nr:hypothetical protein OPT61_g10461 [Boeremia exigua]